MIKDAKPYVFDKRGMKQVFESGFKTFDQQTNIITTGAVIANTQISEYIRPWSEVKNYGYVGQPGQFMKYDLQFFGNIPDEKIRSIIYDRDRKESVILYKFFIHTPYGIDPIGFVLTDYDHKHLAHCYCFSYGCSTNKRIAAIDECMNYICEGWWSAHKEAS